MSKTPAIYFGFYYQLGLYSANQVLGKGNVSCKITDLRLGAILAVLVCVYRDSCNANLKASLSSSASMDGKSIEIFVPKIYSGVNTL